MSHCHVIHSSSRSSHRALTHPLTQSLRVRALVEWSVWFGKIEKAFLPSFTPTPTNITPFMMTLAGWLAGWLVSE